MHIKIKRHKHLISFGATIIITAICVYIVARPSQEELDMHLAKAVSSLIRYSSMPQAEDLIKMGANVNSKDKYGRTPLHRAACFGDSTIELLIKYGANIDSQTNTGVTPLMEACLTGNLKAVKILLAHGANYSLKDKSGHDALWYAKFFLNSAIEFMNKEERQAAKKQQTAAIEKQYNPVKNYKKIVLLLQERCKR